MGRAFEEARTRMLQTWVRDRWNLLGFECDLEHGLEECSAIASWEIAQSGEAERMFMVRCHAAISDCGAVERGLEDAIARYVAYRGDNAREFCQEGREMVLRFATRSRSIPSLVATGEIWVTLRTD